MSSKKEKCKKCKNERFIYRAGFCRQCDDHNRIKKKLLKLKDQFIPICEYNSYIFQLYLQYLIRCSLHDRHFQQAKTLKIILESKQQSPFLSWSEIYEASKKFKIDYSYHNRAGCPYIKIGYMLQELAILPPRSDETNRQLNTLKSTFDKNIAEIINDFIKMQKKTNRSQLTIIRCLRFLRDTNQWLLQNYKKNLFLTQTNDIQNYLDMLKVKNYSHRYIYKVYNYLNMFYRWCLANKHIIYNPCATIIMTKEQEKITICSDEQWKSLIRYVKDTKSDIELAFYLSLIIFFGFKSSDLRFAKIEFNKNQLLIILRRTPLTYGSKYYNRDQIITLPTSIPWFLKLQIKFYKLWTLQYSKIKMDYPLNPLLVLPRNSRHLIRPIGKNSIAKLIYKGTIAAAGCKIPIRVLHQTCGHMHVIGNDASLLNRLGWSQDFSFKYICLPKIIYHAQPTGKTTDR
jgi:hypothetical protein